MPIVTHEGSDPGFAARLEAAGIPHIDEATAAEQEIYPLSVALMNLMPAAAMRQTETQWLRWFGDHPLLQIEAVGTKFDNDWRERPGGKQADILKAYTPLSQINPDNTHIMVVTGANLELQKDDAEGRQPLPLDDIEYIGQLRELIDFSQEVPVTIFSCLAAHAAMQHRFGLERRIPDLSRKILGVFEHEVLEPESRLMRSFGDTVLAPHSRWGDTSLDDIQSVPDLKVLAASPEVGWLAVQQILPNGNISIYLQGHPEYDRLDLDGEYRRDRKMYGDEATMPRNYYPGDDPATAPHFDWLPHTRVLHENILGRTYAITEARRRAGLPFPLPPQD